MSDQMNELINRIDALEQENQALHAWQESVLGALQQMTDFMETQEKKVNALQWFSNINRWRIDSLRYELQDPDYQSPVFKPKMFSADETRTQIVEGRKSIARLGDCEFAIIGGVQRWNYQRVQPKLQNKLREVLKTEDDGFLIGLNPNFYGDLSHLSDGDADGVRSYMTPETRKLHAELLNPARTYADALFYSINSEDDMRCMRKLWDQRDCVFIEGEYTRMGVGNDLFDNCRSIARILCPAENAFDRYEEILDAALKQPKDRLILLALGPTATVLACDLFRQGYQAIDIGHIDLVYEKFLAGYDKLTDVNIPYKYCNSDEITGGRTIATTDDPAYAEQIIERIV